MMIRKIKARAPNGAYCRIMAWMLILRAALRYFSDSVRNEVDRCDISEDSHPRLYTGVRR